jgi:hypothetical protein
MLRRFVSLANFAWLSSASLAQGFRGKVESFPPSLVILCLLRCTLIILKFPKTSAGRVSLALSRTKARTQSLPMSGSFRRIAKVACRKTDFSSPTREIHIEDRKLLILPVLLRQDILDAIRLFRSCLCTARLQCTCKCECKLRKSKTSADVNWSDW